MMDPPVPPVLPQSRPVLIKLGPQRIIFILFHMSCTFLTLFRNLCRPENDKTSAGTITGTCSDRFDPLRGTDCERTSKGRGCGCENGFKDRGDL